MVMIGLMDSHLALPVSGKGRWGCLMLNARIPAQAWICKVDFRKYIERRAQRDVKRGVRPLLAFSRIHQP